MFTQIGKQLKVTAQVAALGLLSVAALGARADSTDMAGAPALIGQMEVVSLRLAEGRTSGAPHRAVSDSVALLGAMTVTATRIPTMADETRQPSSGGDSTVARERSPRAVLVQ